jgi:CRISPR-associated protein Cas1
VLPQAFIAAAMGEKEGEFRHRVIDGFQRGDALDTIIDGLKATALQTSVGIR